MLPSEPKRKVEKSFLAARDDNKPHDVAALDNYVAEIAYRCPLRAARFRRDLGYFLKQAKKDGVEW